MWTTENFPRWHEKGTRARARLRQPSGCLGGPTMTATLDLLEGRGWVVRRQNPADRRGILVEITPAGQATADGLLAGIWAIEGQTVGGLTAAEHKQLLRLVGKVLASAADVAAAPPTPLQGRRHRPRRLDG
jgi:hypothetical protein